MRKALLALTVLAFLALTQPVNAQCYTGGSWAFSYCQNVTVYNNDTLYALAQNNTYAISFDHANLVTAGKSLTSGADVILAYGKQELARFNGTNWNNNSVPIYFNLPKAVAAGNSDSNYSFYYGDASATLASRNANISQVFQLFGDDFQSTNLNSSGQWQDTAGGGAGQYTANCGTNSYYGAGFCSIFVNNGSAWNFYGFNKTNGGVMNATNSSVVFRIVNGTSFAGPLYIGGVCQSTDLGSCGGIAEPAYTFRGSPTGLYWGSDLAASLDYVPSAGIFHILDIRMEPVANRQQYWRNVNQTNPGNTTLAVTTYHPAFGVDGAGSTINFTIDWIGVRTRNVVNEPTILAAPEQAKTTPNVQIYNPTNTTYYNGTTKTVVFSVNSTTNNTNMMVFIAVNNVYAYLGTIANGTTNTTTINVTSNTYNLTITAYDTTDGNGTTSQFFTFTNGLNVTVYNASQGTSTYLNSVTLNASTTANFTVASSVTTPYTWETRLIPNGAIVNIAAAKTGYASTNTTSIIYSNASAFYNVFIPLWRHQEFHLDSGNGTNVTSYTLTLYQSGLNNSYSTTNGTIQISLGSIPTGTTIAQFSANGYNATNQTFNINSTSEINFTATTTRAGLIIYAYDEVTPTQRIYFSFTSTNSSTTAQDYNSNYFWNASYTNTSLTQGLSTLMFNNTVNGTYGSRSYILTIDSTTATILNVYLLNYSIVTAVYENVCTITSAGTAIAGATVTFQKSISGSYVTVAQLTTGSDGCGALWTNTATLYQIIASATGYNTGTVTAYGKGTQYLVLTSTTATLGWGSSYTDSADTILARLLPETTSLTTDPATINYTVYSSNATLTSFGMYCDYNGTSIYNVNVSGSPSGGSTTSSIALSNKTNPTSFYCYGFFSRSGYNDTYVNRTYQIYTTNTTFRNASISNAVNNSITANFSTGTLTIAAIVLTTVGTAGLTGISASAGAPLGAGIISTALITGFGFLGWINPLLVLLYWVVALAFAYFNSRQF